MGLSGQLHAVAALPLLKEPLIPTEWEAWWPAMSLWTFQRTGKLSCARNRTQDHPAHCLITVRTELS